MNVIKVMYQGHPDVPAASCSELGFPRVILGGAARGTPDALSRRAREPQTR
jgi:hypothetical protein